MASLLFFFGFCITLGPFVALLVWAIAEDQDQKQACLRAYRVYLDAHRKYCEEYRGYLAQRRQLLERRQRAAARCAQVGPPGERRSREPARQEPSAGPLQPSPPQPPGQRARDRHTHRRRGRTATASPTTSAVPSTAPSTSRR